METQNVKFNRGPGNMPIKLHPAVDTWDARLAEFFTDDQKQILASLAATPCERPYPVHLQQPTANEIDPAQVDKSSISSLHTLADFEKWFSGVESSMLDEQELKAEQMKLEATKALHFLDELVLEVRNYGSELGELQTRYEATSNKTNALHTACQNLSKEQTQLARDAEDISEKLGYFNEYDRIMQKLNSPLFSPKSESFTNLLQRIEECIAFLTEHPDYKESANYLLLFQRAQSKALVMIKSLLQTTLSSTVSIKSTPGTTMDQSSDPALPAAAAAATAPHNSFSVLYGKFRAISSSMKLLIEQLEERSDSFAECRQILDDCESVYFSARQSLVGDSVAAAVRGLLQKHQGDHCGLFRNGTFLLLQVCVDETELCAHFFSRPSNRLEAFLGGLCNNLYDALRPLIVHIIHLETLAELCSILKSEILVDKVGSMREKVPVFEATCKQLLEDVQERLVYRTQMYIRSDIQGYNPVPGDLAYPDKLVMMREIALSLKKQNEAQSSGGETSSEDTPESPMRLSQFHSRKDSSGSLASVTGSDLSPADMHGMWYPTLRRALVCLSKLYRCLDIEIFRGLAQETLGCCMSSLQFASNQISTKKGRTDGELFLIKHLLILREQIQPFHSEFSVTETVLDFSKTRLAALGLLTKRNRLFSLSKSNALLQFLIDGSPQVTETTVDSKKDVDTQLKRYCELFVEQSSKSLCDPLMQFMEKAKVIIEVKREQSKVSLRVQPFANANKLQDVVGSCNKLLKSRLPKLKDDMSLYLANRDTEAILFRPVMSKVLKVFSDMETLLMDFYTEEDRLIIGLPSNEQMRLQLSA